MFRCTKCFREINSNSAPDRCPHCGVWFSGVRCESCHYTGSKFEFAGAICPKCFNRVSIPYFNQSSYSSTPSYSRPKSSSSLTSYSKSELSRPLTKNEKVLIWSVIGLVIFIIIGYTAFNYFNSIVENRPIKQLGQQDSQMTNLNSQQKGQVNNHNTQKNRQNVLINSAVFTDPRDHHIYKTIKIGNQILMAENLLYKSARGKYWVYGDDTTNIAKYGYLYDFEAAKNVAPKGWHLPTKADWDFLVKFLSKSGNSIYNELKEDGYCGFNALSCGYRSDSGFQGFGSEAIFWSNYSNDAFALGLYCNSVAGNVEIKYIDRRKGFSVRLFQD